VLATKFFMPFDNGWANPALQPQNRRR